VAAESSFTRAIYVGRLQQLSSGRSLALQAQERSTIVEDFVPLAFHVDYWTILAGAILLLRRMDRSAISISASWKNDGVYTPGFVLDGRESQGAQRPMSSTDKPGVLKITFATRTLRGIQSDERAQPTMSTSRGMLGFDLNNKPAPAKTTPQSASGFVCASVVNEKMSSAKAEIHLATDSRAGASPVITAPNQLERSRQSWMASAEYQRSNFSHQISMLPRITMTSATVCRAQVFQHGEINEACGAPDNGTDLGAVAD